MCLHCAVVASARSLETHAHAAWPIHLTGVKKRRTAVFAAVCILLITPWLRVHFYRAMHVVLERYAIVSRPSVCPSVRPSVCDVDAWAYLEGGPRGPPPPQSPKKFLLCLSSLGKDSRIHQYCTAIAPKALF